jgi:hypothetical protein
VAADKTKSGRPSRGRMLWRVFHKPFHSMERFTVTSECSFDITRNESLPKLLHFEEKNSRRDRMLSEIPR